MLYGALQRLHMESRYDVNVWCAGILTLVLVRCVIPSVTFRHVIGQHGFKTAACVDS